MNDFQPYKSYTSYGEALVAFSALKAGGFRPILQNLHTAQMNMFEALALGGYWIFLPQDEHIEAFDWQDWLSQNPIEDSVDDLKTQHYWGTAFFTAGATFNIFSFSFLLLGGLIDKRRHP